MGAKLFSSMRLGGLDLRNRIVVSPMCMYSAIDGVAQPWHTMHIGSLATSGAALVIMEATGVEAAGRISPGCLSLENDLQERAFATLRADIRDYCDTPIGIQLGHAGRRGSRPIPWKGGAVPLDLKDGGWELVAPSSVAFAPGQPTPRMLNRAGMNRIRDAFVQAAQRADRAGFDLVEIHSAHGYLLHSFLSPLSNFRDDDFGGSLENRMRFPLEVVRAVRAAWPKSKALGVRINGEDWHPSGATIEDMIAYAGALKEADVDYVVVSGGNSAPDIKVPPSVPGYLTHYAERVRKMTGIPTMAVGMILTPHQANEIVTDSRSDLVCIARAFLDDPRWGLHAATALGEPANYPGQIERARAGRWPGYEIVRAATRAAGVE